MGGYADLQSGKMWMLLQKKIHTLPVHTPYAVSAHPRVTGSHQSHYWVCPS